MLSCGETVIVLLAWLLIGATGKGMQCHSSPPPTATHAASPVDNEGLFLNTNTPISCSGTVTAWKVCYFVPGYREHHDFTTKHTRSSVTLAVYQRISQWAYTLIVSSIVTITRMSDMDQENNFVCERVELETDDQFFVQEGDVIGVCFSTEDASNLEPLGVISEDRSARSTYLFYLPTLCGYASDVVFSDLSVLPSHQMHVAVETASNASSVDVAVNPTANTESVATPDVEEPVGLVTSTLVGTSPSPMPSLYSQERHSVDVTIATTATMETTGVERFPESTGDLGKSTTNSNLETFTIASMATACLVVTLAAASIVYIAAVVICVRRKQKGTFEQPPVAGQGTMADVEVRRPHPLTSIENHYVSCPEYATETQPALHRTYESSGSTSSVALVGGGEGVPSDSRPRPQEGTQQREQRGEVYQELSWSHQQPQGIRRDQNDIQYSSIDFDAMQHREE